VEILTRGIFPVHLGLFLVVKTSIVVLPFTTAHAKRTIQAPLLPTILRTTLRTMQAMVASTAVVTARACALPSARQTAGTRATTSSGSSLASSGGVRRRSSLTTSVLSESAPAGTPRNSCHTRQASTLYHAAPSAPSLRSHTPFTLSSWPSHMLKNVLIFHSFFPLTVSLSHSVTLFTLPQAPPACGPSTARPRRRTSPPPPTPSPPRHQVRYHQSSASPPRVRPKSPRRRAISPRQGLTLVHFSAQLEPCLTHTNPLNTRSTP